MKPSTHSEIFIANTTVLDCAVLLPEQGPRGRSWYVDVRWKGKKDEDGVVFDFSLAKKHAKKFIDEEIDHRLVVGESQCQSLDDQRVLVSHQFEYDGVVYPFILNTYRQSLCIVPDPILAAVEQGDTQAFSDLVAHWLLKQSPENLTEISIKLRLHENYQGPSFFSYTHSLKNHFGNCQRFHGHSNIIEVLEEDRLNQNLTLQAKHFLASRYLVAQDYISKDAQGELFAPILRQLESYQEPFSHDLTPIQYKGSQGEVALMIPSPALIIMPAESSIENIADFVHYALGLESSQRVVAYEGLSKGSVSQL